jgi:hypothetical protein
VRELAMIAFSDTPIDSMSWSRKARCTSVKGENEPSSITPSTWSSNRTGSTTMLTGAASPSPEVTGCSRWALG